MVQAKKPVSIPHWKVRCVSIATLCAHTLSAIILIISGITILVYYSYIMLGNLPSPVQLLQLNYSIYLFGGSAVFLFLYSTKLKERIEDWLGIKRVPAIARRG